MDQHDVPDEVWVEVIRSAARILIRRGLASCRAIGYDADDYLGLGYTYAPRIARGYRPALGDFRGYALVSLVRNMRWACVEELLPVHLPRWTLEGRKGDPQLAHLAAVWSGCGEGELALFDLPAGDGPEAVGEDELAKLNAARALLTEREREVVDLRLRDGLNFNQVAAATGTTRQNCCEAYQRALDKLGLAFGVPATVRKVARPPCKTKSAPTT